MTAMTELKLAAERVVTASDAHRANLNALVEYGLRCYATLDATIKTNHRFAHHLTYAVPIEIVLPQDFYEIGISRIQAAITSLTGPTITPNKEDVA